MKLGLITALLFVSTTALAETPKVEEPKHKWVGFQVDLGVPDGLGLGVVVRPKVDWLRLNLSGTYNGMAPGVRAGFTLDPIKFPIAPTFTLEGGHSFSGTAPGVDSSPSFSYDYLNVHLGAEVGSRDSWRFFFHGGPSWMNVATKNFGSFINPKDHSITLADPTSTATLFPAFKLGFTKYF